jgi:transposase
MAISIIREDYTAADLRREAARSGDGAQARRLLALALVLEGASRTEAATVCGMDRQTLRDWVHRYNAEGIGGLLDRKTRGREPRLSAEQRIELAAIVEKGPDPEKDGIVRYRRIDLRDLVEERFKVRFHERTIGKILHGLGFRHMSVRPCHPQANKEVQDAFKKTSPRLPTPSYRNAPNKSGSKSGSRTKHALARKAA